MKYVGLDIGTTTISGVLVDGGCGRVLKRITKRNDSHVKTDSQAECFQQPERIIALCDELLCELTAQTSPDGIGMTGQMHGIVYVDEKGWACSHLATWQDERGNRLYRDGRTYCRWMQERTGYDVATGFGLATVFYDTVNHTIPPQAKKICTIPDYLAMHLTGRKTPLIHASNAASMGLFDLNAMDFDRGRIAALGMDCSLLPEIARGECALGSAQNGALVAIPIGDNQASFLGAVNAESNVLINIGTGSQISVLSDKIVQSEALECRPYIDGKYLINGSSLCGGSAYKLLEDFFQQTLALFGTARSGSLMRRMDEAAAGAAKQAAGLAVTTYFRGTRKQPALRGSITGIGYDNFTPGALAYAVMEGVCKELYGFYEMVPDGGEQPAFFSASGNGVRNSAVQRKILEKVFHAPVRIPENPEEAAYGAALLAISQKEHRSWEELRQFIAYIQK